VHAVYLMNPPDASLPIIHFDDDDSEAEELRQQLIRQSILRQRLTLQNARRRRMLEMADKDASSDSDVDEVTKGVQAGKMDVTPASSTPQELVKLDP
jgi:hypothetical protein